MSKRRRRVGIKTFVFTYDASGSAPHFAELFGCRRFRCRAAKATVEEMPQDEWDESLMVGYAERISIVKIEKTGI